MLTFLAGSTGLPAAGHPGFTGIWEMDPAQSDFGMLPKVSEIVDRISEQPSELTVHRTRDGREVVIHIPLDGAKKQNDILGIEMETDAHWDGDALVVAFSGNGRRGLVTYRERWTMATDGKSFHVERHLTSPRGETDQSLIMLKQAAAQ